MLENIIYAGLKESDCLETKYYKSITLFGSGKNGNISLNKRDSFRYNHNNVVKNDALMDDFFITSLRKEIKENPNIKFCYYNKQRVSHLPKDLQKHAVFQPSIELLEFLNDKHKLHKWASKLLDTLTYVYVSGDKINYDYCCKLFKSKGRFVIQAKESLGGGGTFLLSQNNEEKVLKLINSQEEYSISQYVENNLPINIHFLISKNDILLLPASIQVIDSSNDMLEYIGCDYSAYHEFMGNLHNEVVRQSMILLKELQKQGYRGVGGIDYICTKDKIYFMEINARYQTSTSVLNYTFKKAKLPTVNELDAMCFLQDNLPKIPDIDVPYSKGAITSTIPDKFPDMPSIKFLDGYTKKEKLDNDVYLYSLLYKGSILKRNRKIEN